MSDNLPTYSYNGARAMVLLQEQHLRVFRATWEEADARAISLPAAEDYASREDLLHHVLSASRGYLLWLCKSFGLPDPGLREAPGAERVREEGTAYLEHLVDRWKAPLAGVEELRFRDHAHPIKSGKMILPELMMEHAVMHPIRHTFQLRNLLDG